MKYYKKVHRHPETLEEEYELLMFYTEEGYESFIPQDESNGDYQLYKQWEKKGNKPEKIYGDAVSRWENGLDKKKPLPEQLKAEKLINKEQKFRRF